jgi:hypothetical protein
MQDVKLHIQSMGNLYGSVSSMILEIFWFHAQWTIQLSYGTWYKQKQADSPSEVMLTQWTQ